MTLFFHLQQGRGRAPGLCGKLGRIRWREVLLFLFFFDDLKEQGYHAGIYIYPEGGDRESAEARHIAGLHNQMELIYEYSKYVNAFDTKMSHQPFALMACNYISNLSFGSYVDINDYAMDTDYWEAGYRCMERCCGDLLKLLKD